MRRSGGLALVAVLFAAMSADAQSTAPAGNAAPISVNASIGGPPAAIGQGAPPGIGPAIDPQLVAQLSYYQWLNWAYAASVVATLQAEALSPASGADAGTSVTAPSAADAAAQPVPAAIPAPPDAAAPAPESAPLTDAAAIPVAPLNPTVPPAIASFALQAEMANLESAPEPPAEEPESADASPPPPTVQVSVSGGEDAGAVAAANANGGTPVSTTALTSASITTRAATSRVTYENSRAPWAPALVGAVAIGIAVLSAFVGRRRA